MANKKKVNYEKEIDRLLKELIKVMKQEIRIAKQISHLRNLKKRSAGLRLAA